MAGSLKNLQERWGVFVGQWGFLLALHWNGRPLRALQSITFYNDVARDVCALDVLSVLPSTSWIYQGRFFSGVLCVRRRG